MEKIIGLSGLSRFLKKCKDLFAKKEELAYSKIGEAPSAVQNGGKNQVDMYSQYSHAEGLDTTISSNQGDNIVIAGHTEGYKTYIVGGYDTTGQSFAPHAEGVGTRAGNNAEHAEGRYNKSNYYYDGSYEPNGGTTLHSVGIGTSDSDRKNAFEIMQNGDAYLYGVGNYDGINLSGATRLQDVIPKKPVTVYETDGTTGLLGINESSFGTDNWQLTNLSLGQFKYLKCFIKASNISASQFTPSMVIELPLDTAARGSENYLASSSSIIPFNRNRHFCAGVAVDSTKTKFKVIYETTLWDISVSDANSAADGRYLYKIVGYYD